MEGTWQAQLISVCNNGPFCMGVTQLVCLWRGPDGERVWRRAWRGRPGVHELCACVMGKVGTHTAHLEAHVHTQPSQTHTHSDSLSTCARARACVCTHTHTHSLSLMCAQSLLHAHFQTLPSSHILICSDAVLLTHSVVSHTLKQNSTHMLEHNHTLRCSPT